MKKIIIGAVIILNSYYLNFSFAQYGSWKDGTPTFTKIASKTSVDVDSLITLNAIDTLKSQDSDFKFILDGSDWTCPEAIRIISAEDIDYRHFFGSNLYLITDGAGRRVVEIDPDIPQEVWEFKGALGTPQYLEKPVDATSYIEMEGNESVRKVLITDQGNHRVIKVIRQNSKIQWQYGTGTEGDEKNQLSNPSDAIPIPDSGKVFICDKGNNRVILVNEADTSIVWSWGRIIGYLNNPVDIEYSDSTNELLITDQGNHRVIKVDITTNGITWQFGETGIAKSGNEGLKFPSDADLLPDGNVLICDTENNRLIEVNSYGNVIWEFHRPLVNLKDADRLLQPLNEEDKNKHLIVTGNLPSRLGYVTSEFTSPMLDIGKEVSFSSLHWYADNFAGITSVKLQLRTENTLGDLESAEWRGPTDADSFYTIPGQLIHPAHNGHRFYQFRATLMTNNPLYTPVLNDVVLRYKYFNTNTIGKIITETIADDPQNIITRWKTLKYATILPENLANRNKIELKITILDADTEQPLRSFTASNVDNINEESLSNIEELKQKQRFKIQATFQTANTSVSPILDSLEVDWENVSSTPSKINFVDENLQPVTHYRFSESYEAGQQHIDRISIFLEDKNLEKVEQSVPITIRAIDSRDTIGVRLQYQSANGGYLLTSSEPAIIFYKETPIFANILEVRDRDKLVISYTDPTNPADQSVDSVLVVKDTQGILFFENQNNVQIDTTSIGDTIFVRISEENDRNITSHQDTIYARIYDEKTNDVEDIILVELLDTTQTYNSGEFKSEPGLPIVLNNTRQSNDSHLQTISGSKIGIIYDDSFLKAPILQVKTGTNAPDTLWNPGGGQLEFDLAPNPFYTKRNSTIKLRASSSIGNLSITKIEVYTFAGEKVTEIDGTKLTFYYNYPIPKDQFGFTENWWDLKNQDGSTVSSGTYFVKLYGKTANSDEVLVQLKKLLIIK